MPKQRLKKNISLPPRWRLRHGSYYYRPHPSKKHLWDNKTEFRLGTDYRESMRLYTEIVSAKAKRKVESYLVSSDQIILQNGLMGLCGIYFLIQDLEIVYVGQSTNILQRINSHVNGEKAWHKFTMIEVPELLLTPVEDALINHLMPKYNVNIPNSMGLIPSTGTDHPQPKKRNQPK